MFRSSLHLALYWYATSVTTLIFCITFLIFISFDQKVDGLTASKYHNFKALPASANMVEHQEVEFNRTDARAKIIENFFKGYNSPLADSAETFISVADKYKLDYRLLPAISMQESNGAKILPKDSHNPFGYGIYGGKVMRFDSFDQAIERVGRGLRQDYLDKGLTTPQEIMTKYTPPSLAKGGLWAIGVSTFMEELK